MSHNLIRLQLNIDSNGSSTQRFKEYLAKRGIKSETILKYISEWKIVFRDAFLSKPALSKKEAKTLMVAYINLLAENKIANSVIRRRLMTANRFFEFIEAPTTLKNIRLPKRPETKLKVVNYKKLQEIKKIIDSHPEKDFSDICNLVLMTGLRLGEVLDLKFNRQDLNAKRLIVDGRIVVIGDNAIKILARRLVGSVKWKRKYAWYAKTLAQTCPGITFLMLRNLFATESLAQGKPIEFIKSQMGLRSDAKIKHIVAAYMDYVDDN